MAKTKFFRIATSGATTDGRQIDEQWLRDMAETYDPKTYQANISREHYRGAGNYGHVLALKTEPVTLNVGGKPEQRLGLFAQIDALDPLVEMNKAGQKLHASIDVNPNFAQSGKAYLQNLAVTDNPASLGTELLQFCATLGDKSPLAARKTSAGNLFSVAEEFTLEFADQEPPAVERGEVTGLIAALKGLLGFSSAAAPVVDGVALSAAEIAAVKAARKDAGGNEAPKFSLATIATDPAFAGVAKQGLDLMQTGFATLEKVVAAQAKTDAAVADLAKKLDGAPANTFRNRNPATGSGEDATHFTDC